MKKKKTIIIGSAMLLFIMSIILLYAPLLSKKETIALADINQIEAEKKTLLIYIYSSDFKECRECKILKRYLDKNKIQYRLYDKNEKTNDQMKTFLKALHIDPKTFSYPSLIYIHNGKKSSYLMNIPNEERLAKYINEYELAKIK